MTNKSRKIKGQRFLQDVCKLGSERGMCRGYYKRYFFDTKMGKCTDFVYGGCEGNKNRFNNLKDCEKQCSL